MKVHLQDCMFRETFNQPTNTKKFPKKSMFRASKVKRRQKFVIEIQYLLTEFLSPGLTIQ
jgi:hypothetical protein